MTIHDPAAELRANVATPFEAARAMPISVYTSETFLALEQEHVFAKSWLCAGRADALKAPGDYLTMEIAGEPIIVLRDRQGTLRAMSNVCRHRMSILLEGRGTVRTIICPYHAWTYNLDGSLRGAPAMELNESFCKEASGLPAIRCVDWKGWIMVTLDPDLPEPGETLREMDDLVGYLPMQDYVEVFREEHRWNTNWKILAENFMESYHLPMCHGGTIGGAVDLKKMTCPEGFPGFNFHHILKDDSVALSIAHRDNTTLEGDDRYRTWLISVYPSLMITLTPGYFWYLCLTPDGPGHVKILYGGGLHPDFASDPEAPAHFEALKTLLDAVNDEDRGCTERVWKGMQARHAKPGALSHLERPNYEFARWIAGRMPG
ncbi:MAG: (2Fe-2S)-binding protein [Rhodobacteraceae bacterium]|jgi:phenylpropionate dioxygenase-like ring-hydroxylating dioxygenase large terminal subunit|uniref:Ring-hydroxylating dioxygenase, large terminal subunit n=1 Tax=Salipiger profundus TaxID=1229727 RepID=A0A1U7D2A6_9RHOB|nr:MULTISPECIES: SRPBCC family protein [Salipiger]APX22238.1 ring-hydroxylating dioxygenase, large terminal subunit [Salipiger profundus]MAB05250.1 (2Fe-2S)-binding protein [Paracoccaceae bacterium]GGA08449.1 (2Fe-2S)-binding protein [Salipiger profundus]SFC49875.1 Phenylpropionate dioxygenase, large terminal subunit [Salipiger profundus]